MTFLLDHELSKEYKTAVIRVKGTHPLVKKLLEDELVFRKREGNKDTTCHFYRIRPSHSFTLLQELTATKNFLYKDKPLICDFFSRTKLEFIAQATANAIEVSVFGLQEYDLVLQGSPHILVKDRFLRFLDDSISWQHLAPQTLSEKAYMQFKKELLESDTPPELVEFDFQPAEKKCPTLTLSDQTLAFANGLDHLSREQELLQAGYTKKIVGNSCYYCPVDRAVTAVCQLLEKGWRVLDAQGNDVVKLTDCTFDLHAKGDYVQVDGHLTFGEHEVELKDIAKQKGKRLVDLGGKLSGLFDSPKVQTVLEETFFISGTLAIRRKDMGLLAEVMPLSLLQPERLPDIPIEESFTGTLRHYQQVGVNWLNQLYQQNCSGLLADEMGLGKTVQILAFIATKQKPFKTLIVMPTTLLENWAREIRRFLPNHSLCIYHGPKRTLDTADIICTSYGTIRGEQAFFAKQTFDCLVVDEAHYIKNQDAKTTKSLMQVAAHFKVSLTGTPLENSLAELLSQFQFLDPTLFHEEQPELLPLSKIRKKIAPYLLRRKKKDVAKELPEKIEQTILVPMHEEEEKLYSHFVTSVKEGLLQKIAVDGTNKHRMEILEAILRMRQLSCHPLLLSHSVQSAKFDLVIEDIKELILEGKKVILFSQFAQMLHLLRKELQAQGIEPLLLDGETKDRMALVDRFQNDPSFPLFLISLKAGGVGLTLTAADYVLLYDPWWNPAQEAQAIDRAHRIGRKDTLFVRRYITKETIEEKIVALQAEKKSLFDAIIDDGEFENRENDLVDLL